MDKGFQLMIPKEKEETKVNLFDYGIRFSLFGREFNLSFKVNRKE
tara:strand:+ start:295 stop:429 length:135 start_codon:yes stop_codon:yes gene_type:complete